VARAGVRAPRLTDPPDLGLIRVDEGIESCRVEEALVDEQRLERADAQLDLGQRGAVIAVLLDVVRGVMGVVVVFVGHHRATPERRL
jgi:hypothetical protein